MKRATIIALVLSALSFLAVLATVLATAAAIEWTRNGAPLFERVSGPRTIQLGLRSDGVVVWREITRGESTTNSPAEPPPRLTSPAVRDAIQPLWMTNWIYQGDGNILVLTNDIRYGPMPTLP